LHLLKDYLQQGGKVLSFTKDIPYLDGTASALVNELKNSYSKQWVLAQKTDEPAVKELFANPEFTIQEPSPVSGELYYMRRIMDDGQQLFVVNTDSKQGAAATIKARGEHLIKMDLNTGECFSVPAKSEKGELTFEISLPPIGSALYYLVNPDVKESPIPVVAKEEQQVAGSGTIKVNPENENVLVLDFLDVKSNKLDLKDTYFMKAMRRLFDSNGFPMGNPWQHKIQYKQDYLALDTFKVGSGFEAAYHFNVSQSIDLKSLGKISAVVERRRIPAEIAFSIERGVFETQGKRFFLLSIRPGFEYRDRQLADLVFLLIFFQRVSFNGLIRQIRILRICDQPLCLSII